MHKLSPRRLFQRSAASCFSFFLAAAGTAQQVIDNPAKAPSANAGRVISLKEVARITDEKGKFFFVQPFNILTGQDGSVYVQEFKQLLKFDAQGRFVGNLLKRGQGPGELDDNLTDVVVREKDIILWSSNNYKLIRLDLHGRLIEDKKLVQGFLGSLLGAYGGRYFFLRSEIDTSKSRPRVNGIIETPRRLVIVPENGEAVPTPVLMPMTEAVHFGPRSSSSQHDITSHAGRRRAIAWSSFSIRRTISSSSSTSRPESWCGVSGGSTTA